MKKGRKWLIALLALMIICSLFVACSKKTVEPSELSYGDADLSEENAAGLEAAANYTTRFKNGSINIGDVMPYYHDGIYSFFYLAETANHPVYRVDTTDFIHYEEKGLVLSPGASTAQDAMIGTGSIVEANGDYCFFYTGHKDNAPEAVMLAKSSGGIDNFNKVTDFAFTAQNVSGCDLESGDFRDPEAIYDESGEQFILYVSARRGGEPVIAKFTVSLDLTEVTYCGVIYSDTRFGANMLECSDVFKIGNKWYLTYSVQDTSNGGADGENAINAGVGAGGKVYYAVSDSMDGPFTRIYDASLDSHVFYAAKSVQDGENTYLAGWIRQKNSNIGWQYLWGGNLQVHQLTQNADGTLNVALPQQVRNYYSVERKLSSALEIYNGYDMIVENKDYHVISDEYSSYLLHATVSFDSDVSEFGFALAVSSNVANIMEIAFVPQSDKIRSSMSGQQELCSKNVRLIAGEEYDVTLLAEGSCVTVYINDSVAFTSRIRNIGNKKLAAYSLGGSVTMKDFHLYTPSDYADTLSVGGNLKITENGTERTGNVNRISVNKNAPATAEYTLADNNYVRYTAAVYSDKDVKVSVKLGGKTLNEYSVAANRILQFVASTYAAKGSKLTVEFSSAENAEVWTDLAFETDKRPFTAIVNAQIEKNGTAAFTAGAAGVYEYVATMYYGGNVSGSPVFEVGDSAVAAVSENARLVTIRGAVKLSAGESLYAALGYKDFAAAVGAHNIVLQVRTGGTTDTFATGLGTYTTPVSKQCNVVTETVPAFDSIELTGVREMSAEMNTNIFGEQGANGFIYAYGKASDELKPMTEYNTNGDVSEYKHKAPEANDALEIKADFMKQGGGYVTAVIWVAPTDGFIGIEFGYKTNSDNVQIQILVNRSLIYDGFIPQAGSVGDALTSVEVKSGDFVVFAVRTAGTSLRDGDGNYTFKIGEGNSVVPFNPNAPLIADHAEDYNTERNGDYGWKYLDVGYTWDGGEHPTTVAELNASAFGWGSGGKGIDKNGVIFGDATVAWANTTSDSLSLSVSVSVTGSGAYVRVWIIRENGSLEKLTDGLVNGTVSLLNKGIVLSPSDMIAVMFFDNPDGSTLNMQIRTTDEIMIDDTAIKAALENAKQIENTDNRYTAQSFAEFTTAVANAENFVRDMAQVRKTYSEISDAVHALKEAISGLKLDTAAARAELNAQIAAASRFEGKELMGDTAAFTESFSKAQAAADNTDATSDELTAAANALKAAMENATIKVADFASDFPNNQGDNGWAFYKISPANWDNYNLGGSRIELTYGDSAFVGDGATVSVELWQAGGATVAYRNYTDEAHIYTLSGSIEYKGSGAMACVAYVILNADGTYSHDANWNTFDKNSPHIINKQFTLNAGDAVLLVLRDVDGAPTDSALTLSIGCNDVLTVGKNNLNALISEASGKQASDYTADSFAVLTESLSAAQSVANNESATAGEVYRAESALNKAISGLKLVNAITSTDYTDVLNESGLWSVYRSEIGSWDPATLYRDQMTQYTADGDGLKLGDGESVVSADNALKISSDNSGIVFVFRVQSAGTYKLNISYTGENRSDGRVFVGSVNELTERAWIGTDETCNITLTLNAGEYVAIHFVSSLNNALLSFSLDLQA